MNRDARSLFESVLECFGLILVVGLILGWLGPVLVGPKPGAGITVSGQTVSVDRATVPSREEFEALARRVKKLEEK
jgi:hypothetical protein